jgi:hypothetical protein
VGHSRLSLLVNTESVAADRVFSSVIVLVLLILASTRLELSILQERPLLREPRQLVSSGGVQVLQ